MGRARPATGPRSFPCPPDRPATLADANRSRSDEPLQPQAAPEPDRLRGARHVRRAVSRADLARRVGLSDDRRRADLTVAAIARQACGPGLSDVRAACRKGQGTGLSAP